MVDQLKGLGLELIKSKKFAAVVTGCAINLSVLVAAKFGIGEEQAATIATQVSGIIMTYIIGLIMRQLQRIIYLPVKFLI